MKYSEGFRNSVLRKVLPPNDAVICQQAKDGIKWYTEVIEYVSHSSSRQVIQNTIDYRKSVEKKKY